MGQSYAEAGGITTFTVTKSNPSGNIVRFTLSDAANRLTTSKLIRAVLVDAIQQFIDAERADLDSNGDTDVKGDEDYPGVGDGYKDVVFNYSGKTAELTLSSLTGIASTGNITASIPFGDVS